MPKESLDRIKTAEEQVRKNISDAEIAASNAIEQTGSEIRTERAAFLEQLGEERKRYMGEINANIARLNAEAEKEAEALYNSVYENYRPKIKEAAGKIAEAVLK